MSFIEKLDAESLEFFNEVCKKPFSQQAISFLNAYWTEVGDQAEFIFEVAHKIFQMADMENKGISLIHKYTEGNEFEFNIGLFFYEQLFKYWDDPKNSQWKDPKWEKSFPDMQTAIVRKKELREKVDCNFDGKVSMIEYLLYQYKEFANPKDFTTRSMKAPDEDEAVKKARLALEDVLAKIKAYEEEKARLEEGAQLPGVKGLKFKNELAQLDSSPLMEQLNKALITAEAAVRMAARKSKASGGGGAADGDAPQKPTAGAVWWMERDLAEKQKKYGRKK